MGDNYRSCSNEQSVSNNALLAIDVAPLDIATHHSCKSVLIPSIYIWQEVLSLLNGEWIFRGQCNSAWEFKTSAERDGGFPVMGPEAPKIQRECIKVEKANLQIFKDHFAHTFRNRAAPISEIGWFALMQHYGIPTRMFDFTRNVYVAMYMGACQRTTSNAFSVWAIKRSSLAKIRISDSPNDNEALNSFLASDVDSQLAKMDEWRDKIALVDNFRQEDINANWRMVAQDGLFLVPAFYSYFDTRSVLSELLISKFVLNPLLRSRYFGYSAYPPALEFDEIQGTMDGWNAVEFVFPSGIRPLMIALARDNKVYDETICPDRGLVDASQMCELMKPMPKVELPWC